MRTVHDIIEEQDELKTFEYKAYLWPQKWQSIDDLEDLDWRIVVFDATNEEQVDEAPGIYSFVINPRVTNHPQRYLCYIGKTKRTLRERFSEYITESGSTRGRPKVLRMLNKWRGYIDFYYIVVRDGNVDEMETRLNDGFLPPYNSDYSTEVNKIINAFR